MKQASVLMFSLKALSAAYTAAGETANPTHYGDPATGCESDEKAVQVQGVSGDFCSPSCTKGACPSDLPAGDSARPMCALRTPTGDKYCALICTASDLKSNGANGECGTGTCQKIQGVGICTYATKKPEPVVPALEAKFVGANPTHYGDPATGCESDEKAVQVQGLSGDFCSPSCTKGACPSDLPAGDSARPMCALRTPTGDKYCALICTASDLKSNGANGECGTGTCQKIQGVGICTYATKKPEPVVPALEAKFVGANPTHYGDPATGCESDEKAVQVQGLSGDFCSPSCTKGACPSDLPAGDSARPMCALRTPTGDKYCALICTASDLKSNGANGECGTGTCQKIQGVGICTYATKKASIAAATVALLTADAERAVIV